MRFECIEPEMKILFMQNKTINDIIQRQSQYRIETAGYGITECLHRHDLPEGRIEEINDGRYKIPGVMDVFSQGANLREQRE